MKKHFVILGAGISGLSLAWYLKQKWGESASITLIEKSTRVGGWIKTLYKEGFLFEQGPHSCRINADDTTTLELIEALGLENEVITASPQSKIKYLWSQGKLQKMPSTAIGAFLHPLTRKALIPCIQEFFRTKGNCEDESVYDFISRRFSPSFAEQFIDPLVSGIYAGNMRQLSVKSCFPSLYNGEKNQGSVIRGMLKKKNTSQKLGSPFISKMLKESLFSFKKGMETLPLTLFEKLKTDILLSTEVTSFKFNPEGIQLTLNNGQTLQADHCFSTLPTHALIPLLAPYSPNLEKSLSEIPHASVTLVNLGYNEQVFKNKGFGYLVPAQEKEDILGVIWDSAVFPQQQASETHTRLTVMIGGSRMSHLNDKDKESHTLIALNAVAKHLKIKALPNTMLVNCAREAIPQYPVGHQEHIASIHSSIAALSPHLSLSGTAFHGVALNDCISTAKRLAGKDMMQK